MLQDFAEAKEKGLKELTEPDETEKVLLNSASPKILHRGRNSTKTFFKKKIPPRTMTRMCLKNISPSRRYESNTRTKRCINVILSQIHRPLELRVVCLEDTDFHNLHPALTDSDVDGKEGFSVLVTIGLYYGGSLIAPEMTTKQASSAKPCE